MFILDWLKIAVSWILVTFHGLFSAIGLDPDSGWTWTLSIVGLVVVIRVALIPLFVKQIKSQRNLQLIQPQMKEIQKKYAGDREKQSAEMMKLYKETGHQSPSLVSADHPAGPDLLRVVQRPARRGHVPGHTGGRPGL